MPTKYESHCCSICLTTHEDATHLLVTCPPKQEVWRTMLDETTLDPYSVWQILTFKTIPRSKKNQKQWAPTLIKYGRIIQAVWSHHWHVIFNAVSWSHSKVIQRFQDAENARVMAGDDGADGGAQ